jgi:hypothetical protein
VDINENSNSEGTSEELAWIKNLQRNSWEPEVIISGLSLAFIFAFPAQVYDFAVKLTQDYGMEFIGASIVMIYLTMIVSLFKIFFSVHLILRFTWAGLLGLSYAFPQGVINENLFKNSRDYQYKKPQEMVLKLERICSMAFAFPMMMGIIFFILTLYLCLLLLMYRIFDLNFFLIYLIFMASLIVFSLFSALSKKNKLKLWLNSSIFSTVQAVYQSNLGKWTIVIYTFVIMGLTVPLVWSDSKGVLNYSNSANLHNDQLEWPENSMYFEDKKDPEKRFPRVLMPSELISGDYTTISFAHYDEDSKNLEKIKELLSSVPDSLDWDSIDKLQDLYRIYLNDSLISNKSSVWRKISHGNMGQRANQFVFEVKNLEPGIHEIRIEKLVLLHPMGFVKPEIRHRKNWAKFSFIKITS